MPENQNPNDAKDVMPPGAVTPGLVAAPQPPSVSVYQATDAQLLAFFGTLVTELNAEHNKAVGKTKMLCQEHSGNVETMKQNVAPVWSATLDRLNFLEELVDQLQFRILHMRAHGILPGDPREKALLDKLLAE
jgi:hypothetical protein